VNKTLELNLKFFVLRLDTTSRNISTPSVFSVECILSSQNRRVTLLDYN